MSAIRMSAPTSLGSGLRLPSVRPHGIQCARRRRDSPHQRSWRMNRQVGPSRCGSTAASRSRQRSGKKMRDLAGRPTRGESRAVDQVLGEEDAEVAADRAGRGLAGVGGAHHRADDLPGVLRPLDHHDQRRRPADEGDELVVERLALVLGVVAAGQLGVDRAQLGGDDGEVAALEAADDLADESTLDGVGLADDEGAIHGRGRYATRPVPKSRALAEPVSPAGTQRSLR